MNADIGLILDGVVLVFLAVTIFYASRLTIFLKSFRQSRDTVEKLIRDLSVAVDKAEGALQGMHQSTANAGENLQNIVNDANFLSDELRFINETGDNLAERLEKLVERNRDLVEEMEDQGGVGRSKIKIDKQGFNQLEDDGWALALDERDIEEQPIQRSAKPKSKKKESNIDAFMINDREFDDDNILDESDDGAWSTLLEAEQVDTANSNLMSQAERDLYEALQGKAPARKKNAKSSRIKESV
ncbi:MAG: hypothetical protein HRT94_09030 [Alphaproteobacteria bacterium]|nr:hypothetical protein [Alphaproteobacteria bacterium]